MTLLAKAAMVTDAAEKARHWKASWPGSPPSKRRCCRSVRWPPSSSLPSACRTRSCLASVDMALAKANRLMVVRADVAGRQGDRRVDRSRDSSFHAMVMPALISPLAWCPKHARGSARWPTTCSHFDSWHNHAMANGGFLQRCAVAFKRTHPMVWIGGHVDANHRRPIAVLSQVASGRFVRRWPCSVLNRSDDAGGVSENCAA